MSIADPIDTLSLPVGFEWQPIVIALLVGGMIGCERELHGRPAGLRTHMLVCLASTLLIFASRVVPDDLLRPDSPARIVMDPNRLAAGIVTGVGFLGAATVIRAGDIVRGITTGATVWTVAGLGIVIGQGEYSIAIVGAVAVMIVLAGLDPLTRRIAPVIYRRLTVTGLGSDMSYLSARVAMILREHSIRVQDLSGSRGDADQPFELVFHVRLRNLQQAPEMLEKICGERGVKRVEWSQISH
jgi:putative Mg2+ transporter-C (MgtC) family protein